MFEIHDPESNNAQASRSQGQTQSRPDHSASIHSHPRMMRGLQKRLSELREHLVNDKDIGIPAIESAIALLREIDEEPFPGFTEDMIAEFECVRRELRARSKSTQPSEAIRGNRKTARFSIANIVVRGRVLSTHGGVQHTSHDFTWRWCQTINQWVSK